MFLSPFRILQFIRHLAIALAFPFPAFSVRSFIRSSASLPFSQDHLHLNKFRLRPNSLPSSTMDKLQISRYR